MPPFYSMVRLFGRNAQHLALIGFYQGADSMEFIRFKDFFVAAPCPNVLPQSAQSVSPFSTVVGRVAVALRRPSSLPHRATPSTVPHSKNDLFFHLLAGSLAGYFDLVALDRDVEPVCIKPESFNSS